jgi:hypothetical protein
MRSLVSSQISPRAQTAVVVGAIDGVENLDLRGYRAVLWFTRDTAASIARFDLGAENLQVEPIEGLDATRTNASLESLIRSDALHLPSVFVTDEVLETDAQPFAPVIDAISAQFETHQRARTTRQKDGFVWQSQLLANLSAYAHRRVPAAWQGALEGLPAFICGAGPSLDASLPSLKIFAPEGVIFAADSALKALAHVGVTADFALSIDARKTPERCLAPGHASAGRMIVAGISPPDWQHSVAARKLHYLSGRQLSENWLAQFGIEKTTVAVEENCGITALALALHLGCGPIYLFGMDHSVDSKDPQRWHQKHADPEFEKQLGHKSTNAHPTVPGNYQEEIATPLFREWQALDARCAALPANLIFNVIDRGAKLSNTTLMHPHTFAPPENTPAKGPRLEQLAPPDALDQATWADARTVLRSLGDRAALTLSDARREVKAGNYLGAAKILAATFREKEFTLLFGNFTLKLMPHLVRPERVDGSAWRLLIAECEELVELARNVK